MMLPQKSGPSDPEEPGFQILLPGGEESGLASEEEDRQRQTTKQQPRTEAARPTAAIQVEATRQKNDAHRNEQEVEHGPEAAWRSTHVPAAIHVDGLAGDVAVAGEHDRHLGDFLDRP